MQSIRTLEPRITDLVQHMSRRLHEAHVSGSVMHLNYLFTALSMDVIAEYCLGKAGTTNSISMPEMGRWWYDLTRIQVPMNAFFRHFPLLMRVMLLLPDWLAVKMSPDLQGFIWWRNSLTSQVKAVLEGNDVSKETTVIQELASSALPASEKTVDRLVGETNLLLGAGAETTASTIARTSYHILANPSVLKRLQEELMVAIPNANVIPPLAELSHLPYLNAVIEEGLRIALPVLSRSPRVFQDHALQYKEWTIPPGVSSIRWHPVQTALPPSANHFPIPYPHYPTQQITEKPILADTGFTVTLYDSRFSCHLPRTGRLQTLTLAFQRKRRSFRTKCAISNCIQQRSSTVYRDQSCIR
jgi:cytochrome P450